MFLKTKKIIEILNRYKINLDQLFILHCIALNDNESLAEYSKSIGVFDPELIMDLVNKDLLVREQIPNYGDIEFLDLYLTEKAKQELFVATQIAGVQLWNAYPDFIIINGTKTITKKGGEFNGKYWDKQMLIELYCEKIGFDVELHKKIINTVKIADSNNMINFVIRSFIWDELWESLFVMVEDQIYSKVNVI
jgi:hypothetical protein